MGNLKPGATYEYEYEDDVTYARIQGETERTVIGYSYPANVNSGAKELASHSEWINIRLAAKKDPALQAAVDRVKLLYYLSKNNGPK